MTIQAQLARALAARGLSLSTAESLTCGLIASKMGEVPGVSAVYAGGIVSYMPQMKVDLLGVSESLIDAEGTVSAACCEQMVRGLMERTGTDLGVAATGNAGPDPSEGKPVGLVYLGVGTRDGVTVREYHFEGDRASIREKAATEALKLALEVLGEEPQVEKTHED